MLNVKNDNFKLNVKRTWKYIKKAKSSLIGYGSVSVVEAIITTILPLLSAKIILNMTNGVINQLIISSVAVLFIELILYLMVYFKGFFYQKIYQKTLIGIQKDVTREILNLEIEEIDKLLSRFGYDIPIYDIDTFEELSSTSAIKMILRNK